MAFLSRIFSCYTRSTHMEASQEPSSRFQSCSKKLAIIVVIAIIVIILVSVSTTVPLVVKSGTHSSQVSYAGSSATSNATRGPTSKATSGPTSNATSGPTSNATTGPTSNATRGPTSNATRGPTSNATRGPTSNATSGPTSNATSGPKSNATSGPTSNPTTGPTSGPTSNPTAGPTSDPTSNPTAGPTSGPTSNPTAGPTTGPTSNPTAGPTSGLTSGPTSGPTSNSTIACNSSLGMEDGRILDEQLTASTFIPTYEYSPASGRLKIKQGSWAATDNDLNQWFQVDFRSVANVTGIATQGSQSYWVKSYGLQYSNNGSTYEDYEGGKIFSGNSDHNTVVKNDVNPAIFARYIRVRPKTWNDHIVMRVELYGCK